MPNCADNYENEISDGKNARSVKCKYCGSKILNPGSANFFQEEFELPLIKQRKSDLDGKPECETISLFWEVADMYTFENIGISNTVENYKYLTCADCESGPVGYHDLKTKKSYVALSRVVHA